MTCLRAGDYRRVLGLMGEIKPSIGALAPTILIDSEGQSRGAGVRAAD
jgi:hypothetical protein